MVLKLVQQYLTDPNQIENEPTEANFGFNNVNLKTGKITSSIDELDTMFDAMMAVCLQYSWHNADELRRMNERNFLKIYRQSSAKREKEIRRIEEQNRKSGR